MLPYGSRTSRLAAHSSLSRVLFLLKGDFTGYGAMSDDFSPLAAAACGFGAAIFLLLISKLRGLRVNDAAAAEPRQPTKGNATVPVKLLQIDAAPNTQLVGSTSPFCLKVESVLRVTGIPHTIEAMPPPKAPKGKLPCIVHGANTIWDSQLISDYLTNTFSPDDPSFGGKLAVPTGERAAVLHGESRSAAGRERHRCSSLL